MGASGPASTQRRMPVSSAISAAARSAVPGIVHTATHIHARRSPARALTSSSGVSAPRKLTCQPSCAMTTASAKPPMKCRSPAGHAIIATGPRGQRATARCPASRCSTAVDRRCSAATAGSPAAQRRPRSASVGYTTSSMACTSGSAANARSSSPSMRGESPWRADALIREMSESTGRVSAPASRVDSALRPDTASEMRCPSATRAASHSTRSISAAPYRRWPPTVRHGRSTP